MELNKSLEYRICFDRVKNLDEIKKNENYVGSIKVEGNTYVISIEGKKRLIIKGIIHEYIPMFKDIYYKKYRAKGEIPKQVSFQKQKCYESAFLEN